MTWRTGLVGSNLSLRGDSCRKSDQEVFGAGFCRNRDSVLLRIRCNRHGPIFILMCGQPTSPISVSSWLISELTGLFGGGDDVEHQVNYASPAKGEWVSYNIPLTVIYRPDNAGHTWHSIFLSASHQVCNLPYGLTISIFTMTAAAVAIQDRPQPHPHRLHGMPQMWFRFTVMPILPSPLIISTPDGAEVCSYTGYR